MDASIDVDAGHPEAPLDGGVADASASQPLGWFEGFLPTHDELPDAGDDAGPRAPPECVVDDDVLVPFDDVGVVVTAGASMRDEGFGFAVGFGVVEGVDTFVRFRLLDECGAPVDEDVDVDATGRAVAGPFAAPLPDGGFAVAWSREDAPGDGEGAGVLFHRYDLDGAPRGGTTLANEVTFDDQLVTSAVGLPDGFALAWEGNAGVIRERPDALFATFDGMGEVVVPEENLDPGGNQEEFLPVLGSTQDGSMIVGWSEFGPNPLVRLRAVDGSWTGFWAFYVVDGDEPGLVTGFGGSEGGYVAALTTFLDDPDGDVDLVLVDDFEDYSRVEVSHELGDGRDPLVAPLPGGDWFIAWTDRTHVDAADESGTTVRAQRFDSAGVEIDTDPFVVPTTTASDQDLVSVTAGAGGTLVVWLDASGVDDRDGGLRARLIPHSFEP